MALKKATTGLDALSSVGDRMRRVRQRDTAPEVRVRSLLHQAGIRFRVCPRELPGRPDIANRSRRWAIFVHGCFWHGHLGCRLSTVPKTNREFWVTKLAANRERDLRKARALEQELGYKVMTVWQCELDDPTLPKRLVRAVRDASRAHTRTRSKATTKRS